LKYRLSLDTNSLSRTCLAATDGYCASRVSLGA
jgi:hypothetical protein